MTIWIILLALSLSAACVLAGRILLHFFQLESYQYPGFFRTVRRQPLRVILPGLLLNVVWAGGIVLMQSWLQGQNQPLACVLLSALLLGAGFLLFRWMKDQKAKKPLVMTARVKRLCGVCFVVYAGLILLFCRGAVSGSRVAVALALMFPVFLPVWFALAALPAWGIEKIISELYFRDAQRVLRSRPDLIRIGITGSWGKTSVKFILGTLLEEKFHTLVTPASFNTPMGVTKVIRSSLEPGHRVFIAEMGARHVGDIKEMCRLVHPELGVLTSVGPQHLDTFKTVERVARTKYELMDAIPENGACFFADDDGICLELYRKTGKHRVLSGLFPERDQVWAEDIRYSREGSRFLLCTPQGKTPCETVLLGELNIRNILLAASVCLYLGLTEAQVARGVRKLQPVEHRLQLISNPGGLTVIDDAFNSNILGARQAFRVLKDFSGRRIIVTPGMVELGDREEALNRELGEAMTDCCDQAILVGEKQSRPIREGLLQAGFPEAQILTVKNLSEAEEWLRTQAGAGDTVLFENDLPDHYEG